MKLILCPASSHRTNREDSRDHRSPPVYHPECERRGRAGSTPCGWVWPAHRAAKQQAGTVQKTDGETGFSTGGTETSPVLRRQGAQTSGVGQERHLEVSSLAEKNSFEKEQEISYIFIFCVWSGRRWIKAEDSGSHWETWKDFPFTTGMTMSHHWKSCGQETQGGLQKRLKHWRFVADLRSFGGKNSNQISNQFSDHFSNRHN